MRSPAELAALLGAGALAPLAYLALGLWIARALRLTERGSERLALAYAFGTGAASLAILALRALDWPLPWWGLAALAASGALARRDLRGGAIERPRWARAFDAAALLVAGVLLVAALAPETAWDGFEYHLPMVQAWTAGPLRVLPGLIDAEFRAGVDLLYVPAVALGQPDAAAAVSAGFAAALAAALRAECTRRASAAAGSVAALFVLLVPFTVDAAPSTYVDLGVGLYGFLALLAADRWSRSGEASQLTRCALLLAFAANAKLHAAILVPAAAGLVLAGGRPPPLGALLSRGAALAALTLPWFAKAAITSGNPLFPLFGEWLGHGPSSAEHLAWKRGHVYYYVKVDRDLPGFLRYLASLTFGRTYHVSGLLGPLPLALAPLAAARPARPTAVLIAVLAALFALQFAFMPALRFGTPLLPFLGIAAAVGGLRLARSGDAARAALVAAVGASALAATAPALATLAPRLGALRDPAAYERRVAPVQVGLRTVVARGEPVVAIPQGAVSWMPKPVYNLHWARNGELFFDGRTPPAQARELLRARGVHSLAIDAPAGARERVGHPIVDAWLASGEATLRPDPDPPPAGRGRVWRLVDLHD